MNGTKEKQNKKEEAGGAEQVVQLAALFVYIA